MQQLVRPTLIIIACSHLLVAGIAFLTPSWFYSYIGHFPPYNAHYIADIGAFNLPLGMGLLIAARDPTRYRVIIGLAALGNLAHALSHLRDVHLHLPPHTSVVAGMAQEAVILLLGLVLLRITLRLGQTAPAQEASRQSVKAS